MFHRIVVPTDFSECAREAWSMAKRLGAAPGSELILTHVLTEIPRFGEGFFIIESASKIDADCARDKRIDLIVMGTHGRTGVSQAILGSVAEAVVRLAPCLVMTVPGEILDKRDAGPAGPAADAAPRPCLVCGGPSDDLICEGCRTRIRAEALDQKREAERPGRRGLPV